MHEQVIKKTHLPVKRNVGLDITHCAGCVLANSIYTCLINLEMATDITWNKCSQVASLNFERATNFLNLAIKWNRQGKCVKREYRLLLGFINYLIVKQS